MSVISDELLLVTNYSSLVQLYLQCGIVCKLEHLAITSGLKSDIICMQTTDSQMGWSCPANTGW